MIQITEMLLAIIILTISVPVQCLSPLFLLNHGCTILFLFSKLTKHLHNCILWKKSEEDHRFVKGVHIQIQK
jgi:hypothetical protein